MIALLLLGTVVCAGLSQAAWEKKEDLEYGTTVEMKLKAHTDSIDFQPKDSVRSRVVWKYNGSVSISDSRQQVKDSYYVIRNVTQRDSGRYVMSDRNRSVLSLWYIEVKEKQQNHSVNPGESLSFSTDLEGKSCNIYFFPKVGHHVIQIVRQGSLHYSSDCDKFHLLNPCGIYIYEIQMSCDGHFELRDQHDDKALVVRLEMEDNVRRIYTAIGVSVGLAVFFACYVKCCCCGKSSSDKSETELPADPDVTLQEYNIVPAGLGRDQPSQPLMPLYPVPSYTQTNALLHNQSAENAANAEVPAPAPAPADAVAVPNGTDYEPHFDLKGMSFPLSLPLSSDSAYQDVYTSDKLNFK